MLYVEDEEAIRECFSHVLTDAGFEVDAVETAEAGAERLRARPYDVVLTDLSLPGESGAWLLETARRNGTLGRARPIVVTAHTGPVPVDSSVPVLRKPVEFYDLVGEVEAAAQQGAEDGLVLFVTDCETSRRAEQNLRAYLERAAQRVRVDLHRVDHLRAPELERLSVNEVPALVCRTTGGRLTGDLSDPQQVLAFVDATMRLNQAH